VKDTVLSGGYGLLDNLTWGAIWQAVKQEQHDLHPKMDMKSEAFLRICGDRASEIFDKTQVVDSTFHRSDAMRSKQIATKLFTAFMSEPTLTLNVFRASVYDATEAWKSGDKTKAFRLMRKTISVLLVQAAFVSIAQALADAWRGKDPGLPWDDDDDDEPSESYWARFLHNMVYNMFDQLHLENNMYLIKDVTPYINYMISKGADYADNRLEEGGQESARMALGIARAVMGWDQDYLYSQNNLVFAAFENAANGTAQIFKKLEKGEDYDKDWYDIMQKTFSGFGTALGIPAGTLMRDFKPIWDKVFASAFAADSTGEIAKAVSSIGKSGKSSSKESKSEDSEGSGSEGSWDDVYKELEAEQEALAKLEEKAAKKAASAPAGQRDEVLWDTLTDGYTSKLKEGHMDYIDSLRDIYVRNGGREEVFDSKLLDGIKRSYKSTINAENTADQMEGQYDMQQYMLNHGVTAEEISDMCYHSYTAKDLKAAMRLGNEEYMIDELVPLIQAGFSEEDFNKCWKQRYNYRNYTGKYTDPKYRISTGTYAWPITGTITSRFGGRKSPGGIGSTNHMGLDIAGSMGDPVHAADGGEVIYADWWYGGGNVVRIRHENGEVTEYMHLSGYNCKVGDHVGKGDQIGQVGSTGNSTGPHLHFGVMDKDGNHLDPEVILAQSNKG
jgi:murein DD-endopeptidase MepM/ murein hydrolase activator NlpD